MTVWAPRIAAILVLHLVLIQPNHPAAMTPGALLVFPLELPVIVLLLLAVGAGLAGTVLRVVLVGVLTSIAVLKLADFVSFTALSRGFNPAADWMLVEAAWRLSSGTVGPGVAALAVLLALCAVAASVAALWWATGVIARAAPARPSLRGGAAVAGFCAAFVAGAEVHATMTRSSLPVAPPGAAFTARVGLERIALVRETLADLRSFRQAAATDAQAGRDGLFAAIDRDVLVLFVESYGRASHDGPLYAPTHRATLADAETELRAAGLAMRSSFLRAPTQGGQSWLSHATFALGLRTDDQARYLAALASGRQGLFHLAQRAGFHTAAVMPAITLDWPESLRMGFDTVLPADQLGYRGQPFNWVTMPDQFTLAALDRLVRAPRAEPVFAQVALISSHAPWVPVPQMVPWDAIGDGRIFDPMAAAGDSPEVVWRDHDRVRSQYRDAVDYALQASMGYAARQDGDDAPLMIILGDHPAAGFVAQDDRADVPIHVIGPPQLVDRIADWGWHDGLLPPKDASVIDMSRMRNRLIDAFSSDMADGAS